MTSDKALGTLSWLSALIVTIASAPSYAAPGPILFEFPANNLPTRYEKTCIDGNRNSITLVCADGDCDDQYEELAVERRDRGGARLGSPVVIGVLDDWWDSSITCNRAGDFAVLYRHSDCRHVRSFGADDRSRAGFSFPPSGPCSRVNYPLLRIDEEGGLLGVWTEYSEAYANTEILAQRFSADGAALAEPARLSDSPDAAGYEADAAFDPSGYALVAWQHTPATGPAMIVARLVDPQGHSVAPWFVVNVGHVDYGTEVVSIGGGLFLVAWEDYLREGRVARRVSVDVDVVAATTTTTLAPPDGFPSFDTPAILETLDSNGSSWPVAVFDGADATWSVFDRGALIHTPDDARRWGSPLEIPGEGWDAHAIAFGGDGRGGWLGLYAYRDASTALLWRSHDDGRTWSEPESLGVWDHISTDCSECEVVAGDIEVDAAGNVVVVWGFHDATVFYDDFGERHETNLQHVYSVASHDGGLTWGPLIRVADGLGSGGAGLALDTDGSGTWVVMWIDTSPLDGTHNAIRVARSSDDGRSWNTPAQLAGPQLTAPHLALRQLQLSASPNGEVVAIFTGSLDGYGFDRDVFAIRSADGGRSWQGPVPVNSFAARDGGHDRDPALDTDGYGRWLALWSTLEPLGSPVFDHDVVGALSTDAGASWSAPVRIDPEAITDSQMDIAPRLAADDRGVWLAAWHAGGDLNDSSLGVVVTALAGDRCGDGLIDTGEQCDDGNAVDDDGCDRNCTITGCGNAVATSGEPCDDGNESNQDACLEGCVLPVCGDGHVRLGVEECDDRNHSDLDDCLGDCRLPYCGDGYVRGGEECDDADRENHDGCTELCRVARCHDGYLHAGFEECDDGNVDDHDYCAGDCRFARCGDGWINANEWCEHSIDSHASFCTDTCVVADTCGDADASGEVNASDARRILITATGSDRLCPISACEVDGRDGLTTTDAKMALHMAVGLEVDARCRMDTRRSVVFFLNEQVLLGAFQLFVDYSANDGVFLGIEDRVRCESLVDTTLELFNNAPTRGTLGMGLISLTGFTGPDIARCSYAPVGERPLIMTLTVEDAAAPDLTPTTPLPTVGYRIE